MSTDLCQLHAIGPAARRPVGSISSVSPRVTQRFPSQHTSGNAFLYLPHANASLCYALMHKPSFANNQRRSGRLLSRTGFRLALTFFCAGLGSSFAFASAPAAAPVDFNRQIRPLLSDRCFTCHGPDEGARRARLRLDLAEGAHSQRGDRHVVLPGDPERSELYLRIMAEDAADRMPPPESNLRLEAEEKALIRLWIEQGGHYQSHWAFVAVGAVRAPTRKESAGVENPIDAFVLERLEREKWRPAPEASRESLIRRLRLDLTGLPPSLEEMDRFLEDSLPGAYERLVDRLLADPAYGERRANEWLDLARYADTYGYQNDLENELWPWRDWVIEAFNKNLPYDDFIHWQLAGDLLPSPTHDQVLATAFNRLHRQTNEGGSIEEEYLAEYAADRVQTASTAFLGLTMECARCHDHKYDPVSQEDFFRMFAFFNNIDESGLYSHFTRATPTPTLLLYPEKMELAHGALLDRIAALEKTMAGLAVAARERFTAWRHAAPPVIPAPEPVAAYAFEIVAENETPDEVNSGRKANLVDGPVPVPGRSGQALQFSGDNMVVLKGVGAFNRVTPFSMSLWVRPTEVQERAVLLHRSRAWTDSGSRGYELILEAMRPAFGLIHFWPGNAIQIRALDPLPTDAWSQLTITYDGSSRAAGLRLYRNGEPMAVEIVRDHLFKDILHRKEWGDADVGNVELTLAGRFRDSGFKNGTIDELRVFDRCLTRGEVGKLMDPALHEPGETDWFDYYLERMDSPYRTARDKLLALRRAENDLINDIPEIMVMRELAERRPTLVHERGAYDAPGEAVEPGMPASLLPFDERFPPNRLGLAQWMTDRRNPLTARVAVNRMWRSCFGRGLVGTSEDFGSQGEQPSHPELLDWLALTFMESGWDIKALYRLIVTSATYRQSSQSPPGLLAMDPDNALLARGPKHRLEAEQIRDSALAISGLLSPEIGGPSVRPYQPAGLWEESGTGKTYVQDAGDKLYRRSLYTFWRRTAPPPSMLTFDAVSREVCVARRESTSTPLQALVLLNDPQFLEAARILAQRLMREYARNLPAQLDTAFRLATGRRPAPEERTILLRLYEEQLDLFAKQPDAVRAYLAIGEAPLDNGLPMEQLAAMAVVASTLLNLDEFLMKR